VQGALLERVVLLVGQLERLADVNDRDRRITGSVAEAGLGGGAHGRGRQDARTLATRTHSLCRWRPALALELPRS